MKKKLLFKGPVLTASGYGVHARQILKGLIQSDKFDVSVQATRWGETAFLTEESDFLNAVRNLIMKEEFESKQKQEYDISVQVLIANEFTKLAKINVGVTAGIEVNRVSPEWIIKTNENIDLLVVPSKHSAETFANVRYTNSDGNQITQLQKPVMIVPESVDTNIFNLKEKNQTRVDELLKDQPDFNFLCVGLGLERGFGEDRKNISSLIKIFCENFKGRTDVGLVLKVGLINNSLMDFEATKRKIAELKRISGAEEFPKILLIHGRMTDEEMASLYSNDKVKAFVSLTHGEGYGLPLIEAAACGLPVMATNWSGHIDFLNIDGQKKFVPFDFDLREIPQSAVWANVMEAGSCWAYVKEDDVKRKMTKILLSYDVPSRWAEELAESLSRSHDENNIYPKFVDELEKLCESKKPQTEQDFVNGVKSQLTNPDGKKTLLYTMPMSAGDVYISTGVVNSLRKKFPDHRIYFATQQKYSDILKQNPDIDQVIQFDDWMMNVPLLEKIFDEVYTPNLSVQMNSSNWVHGGKGRLLGDELAAQCHVEFGQYFIRTLLLQETQALASGYICINPGSGKGQWEARNYLHWQEVINNLKKFTAREIVQIGTLEDPLYEGVTDFRGKTSYNQLAYVIDSSSLVIGIDSLAMHLAEGLGRDYLSIFGSSYSTSTGPVKKNSSLRVLIDTPSRYTCDKACYKYQCSVDKDHPCINEISPKSICVASLNILSINIDESFEKEYQEYRPKISGYTHIFNPSQHDFPWMESIQSMLGFCDEVVVVDGGSDDGSVERLQKLIETDDRVKLFTRKWDWSEPAMDGMQKAYARAMCSHEFLWQQDADEIVHEKDYEKIKKLVKRFPKDTNLLSLPVVELWGSKGDVRTDRHAWKWRLSRNDFRITHGIYKEVRVVDETSGKTYAKKGMSDGCEYVDIMTGDYIPHKNFYTQELDFLRQKDPQEYGKRMNLIFEELPGVYHYSWANLERKIRNFRDFWDSCWSNLYNDPAPQPRFPDVKTDEDIKRKAQELFERGGEHQKAQTFVLNRPQPVIMDKWINR